MLTYRPSNLRTTSTIALAAGAGIGIALFLELVRFAARQPRRSQGSDLLICGILIWGQVQGFGFAGERVNEL